VGKSAQFPLHVWLPDAMEGPTPVSALVHSATMVAAGVYLVGRFYPVFTPEVLLVIALIGCFTLFMAATIALVATDIKRVLAYSTLSQLGYMMFALGIGGWVAGMLHLITHAFFKSLLFLCSGSVIHAVHSNEMTDMGGLLKKMPITAWTMFIGCLAIIGAGIPTIIGLSGYYSKDAIIAQGLHFREYNALWGALTLVAVAGAALTAFYMFRLWFMTFLGEPRDRHRYEHAHESPRVMTGPLVVLAIFAVFVATPPITSLFDPSSAYLVRLLEQARPAGTGETAEGLVAAVVVPDEHGSHAHDVHVMAGWIAFSTAAAGVFLACVIYWWKKLSADEIGQQFRPVYRFLRHKWWFDELYDFIFVRPTHFIARRVAAFDRNVIDWIVDGSATVCRVFASVWDLIVDRGAVDGSLNTLARKTWDAGLSLRRVQTGRLRLYVMSIVIGTILLFVAISAYWSFVASA
jgi:NADH-quinone oxidoreductase subunit L